MVCHFVSKVNSVIFQLDNFNALSSYSPRMCRGSHCLSWCCCILLFGDHYILYRFLILPICEMMSVKKHYIHIDTLTSDIHRTNCIDSSLYHQNLLILRRNCLANMLHGCELVMLLSMHTNHIIIFKCIRSHSQCEFSHHHFFLLTFLLFFNTYIYGLLIVIYIYT